MLLETNRERQLEEELALLKQQLASLTGTNRELGVLLALRMGMTLRSASILYILVKRAPAVVSREALHSIFYGERMDGGPEPKIFDVHISRLRQILERCNAPKKPIDTVWNAGYRASPSLVQWVRGLYQDQITEK